MDWLQFGIQWLHVLAGITWFGAVIYADFILIPALTTLPVDQQRSAGGAIAIQANKVIIPAAVAVIVLGVLRGTVFGSIRSLEALGTTYGITWLLALVVSIVTLYWGLRVLGAGLERLNAFDVTRVNLPDGSPNPEFTAIVDDIKRKAGLELLFFFVIFTCMILMRFGL